MESAMQDPVCGMTVQPEGGVTALYKDRTVHFCSTSCRSKFLERPERYFHGVPSFSTLDG